MIVTIKNRIYCYIKFSKLSVIHFLLLLNSSDDRFFKFIENCLKIFLNKLKIEYPSVNN